MSRLLLISFVGSGVLAAAAAADGPLEGLPGHDRYQLVTKQMSKLVVGGRVERVRWEDDGLRFRHREQTYHFDFSTRILTEVPQGEEPARSRPQARRGRGVRRGAQRDREPSPDGEWVAVCHEFNVLLEPADGGESIAVTTDGDRKQRYGKASWVYGEELNQQSAMWWSPGSTKLAFYALDERPVHDYYLVSGLTEVQTELLVEGYPKAGAPNPIAGLMVYDLHSRTTARIDVGAEPEQYIYQVRFSPDGSGLLFNRTNRHQSVLELVSADPVTGETRVVVREEQPTWQKNRPYLKFLEDGERFIWETEKTGFRQYELRHLDGRLLETLTRGEYPAADIVWVDEAAGVMYYRAYSAPNPLNAQLHRVGLDGSGQRTLTPESWSHSIRISPDGKWFITTYETVDAPPASALYDTEGRFIALLAQSDTSKLEELGLEPPELFTFRADDGETDLYGVLYKPSDFDEAKTYPLVVDVYGGPESQRVRSRFRPVQPACELGFLVTIIDNRGTTGRGKAFESATYLKLGTVDLKDQVDGVRHLAQRPYVDGDRVGVFGHSYGGYMAALALLKHPDVFHVSVASSAVTDWRNYDTIYTERYMRTPQENAEGYDDGSCMTFADDLVGDLLIMHGMVDDNVHPSNAWQLIDALQRAGKPFEMKLYPTRAHGLGREAGRWRWRFLYDHLIAESASQKN